MEATKNHRRKIALVALLVLLVAAAPPTTSPSDELRVRTVWKGHERNTEKNKPEQKWPCSARVVSREGDKVTLNFYVASREGRRGCVMEGTIDPAGKMLFKITKTLPGDIWPETVVGTHFSGTINGKSLIINRKSRHGAPLAAEMTLADKDKDNDKD